MSSDQDRTCTHCGATVSRGDVVCKSCGAYLTDSSGVVRSGNSMPSPLSGSGASGGVGNLFASSVPVAAGGGSYQRRFSFFARFYRLFVSPSDAMQDIALAPDYGGVILILGLEFVVGAAVVWAAMQKIHFVNLGASAGAFWGLIDAILAIAVVLVGVLLGVFWVVKSYLVKSLCDSGSGWDFKTAAAVTGYAYIADIVVTLIGAVVLTLLLPEITIDASNAATARLALAEYQARAGYLKWYYTLPTAFLGLAWKSVLGALGTKFGTKGRCSVRQGFVVFFLLGLVRVVFGLFYQF